MSAPITFTTMSAPESSLSDHATALIISMAKLRTAASNVTELLEQAGFAGQRGDTADDLHQALAIHDHLVQEFNVKVRTSTGTTTFCTCAANAAGAAAAELERQGDTPCGITVTPADPDQRSLAAAHRFMQVADPLETALKDPTIGRALRTFARKHPARRLPTTDFKSLAANDRD
ncbi:hypothetical protein GM658_12450 [Pseudoduganella eburnea]|uniref:Uncharacterized protein n=1 Tax=Massilia eburnea TaxID=1776165 RepID=A0A6L6QHN3_9BURK|nr:hypothetical protein [Massilia eburnea]MTW11407.1 hypothetical protein [Massilia eburnea]